MSNKIIMGIGAVIIIAVAGWVYASGGVLPNGTRVIPNLVGGNTVGSSFNDLLGHMGFPNGERNCHDHSADRRIQFWRNDAEKPQCESGTV